MSGAGKTEYLLHPYYRPRPLRHPVDIHGLLRLVGAVVVPRRQGFVCTDERLSGGNSLWRFLVQCLGETCLGRSRADESGTWRSMTRALSQMGEKEPGSLSELVGETRWERECRTSAYTLRIPRGAESITTVQGTFLVGITLRDPNDPGCREALQRAVEGVVANQLPLAATGSESGSVGSGKGAAPPPVPEEEPPFPSAEVFPRVWAAYLQLWASHEAVDLTRVICVHNRLGGEGKGARRKLWRNQSGGGESAAAVAAEPLHALAAAATSVTIAPGILSGYYVPFNTRTGGTGVDAIAFLRLIGAVTVMEPEAYLVTDASQTGGCSLWTFMVRILGPQCLGVKPLTEANTWFALAKAITKLRNKDPHFVYNILGGKVWQRECTVRPHPIMIPRSSALPAPAQQQDDGASAAAAAAAAAAASSITPAPPPTITIAHNGSSSSTPTPTPASAASPPPPPLPAPPGPTTSRYTTVYGTFLSGIKLRDPDPTMEQDLAYAIAYVAPLFPLQERFPEVLAEYRRLWASHDCLPMSIIKEERRHQAERGFHQMAPGPGAGGAGTKRPRAVKAEGEGGGGGKRKAAKQQPHQYHYAPPEYPPPPLRHHPDGRPYVDMPPVHPMAPSLASAIGLPSIEPVALPVPPVPSSGPGSYDSEAPREPTITVKGDGADGGDGAVGVGGGRGGSLYAV